MGSSKESWGWFITSTSVYHEGLVGNFPKTSRYYFQRPKHLQIILDRENGTAYVVRGIGTQKCLGRVFHNLPEENIRLFFCISTNSFFKCRVRYCGTGNSPPTLQYLCQKIISSLLPDRTNSSIDQLPLPEILREKISAV